MQLGNLDPIGELDAGVKQKFISATDVDFTAIEKKVDKLEQQNKIIMILVSILVAMQLYQMFKNKN
jgi:hypothetical protein